MSDPKTANSTRHKVSRKRPRKKPIIVLTSLPQIDGITKYPAALLPEIVKPTFDAVGSGLGGNVGEMQVIFHFGDHITMPDETDAGRCRRLYLQSRAAIEFDLVAHGAFAAAVTAEAEAFGGMGHVIADPGTAVANGLQNHLFIAHDIAVERFRSEDMGIDGTEQKVVWVDDALDGTGTHGRAVRVAVAYSYHSLPFSQ